MFKVASGSAHLRFEFCFAFHFQPTFIQHLVNILGTKREPLLYSTSES